MAEFKKLSAVEAVKTVGDTAHVLIEENGVIKRAPKDEVGGVNVDNLPSAEGEEVNVLCVENGALKQKSSKGFGGSGGGWDVVINGTISDGVTSWILEKGSHASIYEKLVNNEIISVWAGIRSEMSMTVMPLLDIYYDDEYGSIRINVHKVYANKIVGLRITENMIEGAQIPSDEYDV